jgi:hypothetical protein
MAWINALGGVSVLGSYAHGLATNPATRGDLWGNVPGALLPAYSVSMLLAAAGYLLFTYFLFFRTDAARVRLAGRHGLGLFNILYVLVLVPSALWLPLTFSYLEYRDPGIWILIRVVLTVVGLAALAIVAALLALRPRQPVVGYWLAVAGSVAFAWQTAVLDALVWTAFFRS